MHAARERAREREREKARAEEEDDELNGNQRGRRLATEVTYLESTKKLQSCLSVSLSLSPLPMANRNNRIIIKSGRAHTRSVLFVSSYHWAQRRTNYEPIQCPMILPEKNESERNGERDDMHVYA